MPITTLIHVTAAYSNAVLVAILPHVSNFAKKLDLPIPQPITTNQVAWSRPSEFKGFIVDAIVLTNRYYFLYNNGCVDFRSLDDNPYYENDFAKSWPRHAGQDNMTTNQAIEQARDALRKIGYDPKLLHADGPPSWMQGPFNLPDGKRFPYCEIRWESPEPRTPEEETNRDSLHFEINLNKKTIVGIGISSRKNWRPAPKIDVVPELESDYRKRIQSQMFKPGNGSSHWLSTNVVSPTNAVSARPDVQQK